MIVNNKKYLFLIILSFVILNGCLKDDVSPVHDFKLSDNALLLNYLEAQGDYINSSNMPSIVEVDEVYNNLENYLVIDTRSTSEYIAGHISGAINIQNDSLIIYLNSIDVYKYPKIVLVSSDGQASSYYTCLLRLYGVPNVYSLLWGMAQWNSAFSSVWTQNIGDSPATRYFTFDNYRNDSLSALPEVVFQNSGDSFEKKVKNRISDILDVGFTDNVSYTKVDPTEPLFNEELASNFYIVCYGIINLYSHNMFEPYAVGHFQNSVYFRPGRDLKSSNFLQLLPDKKRIVVYSGSGQLSAFVVAYLRVLGYDAKSLLYGANDLFYSYLVYKGTTYLPYVFFISDIRNYNFIIGSSPE
jgi:rhodanese-related sulfurtransferase